MILGKNHTYENASAFIVDTSGRETERERVGPWEERRHGPRHTGARWWRLGTAAGSAVLHHLAARSVCVVANTRGFCQAGASCQRGSATRQLTAVRNHG